MDPEYALGHNNFSWIFAKAPASEFRDARRALTHGTQACELTSWKNESFIDTLASDYAEKGDFQQAVKYQKMALVLFPESFSSPIAEHLLCARCPAVMHTKQVHYIVPPI